MSDGPPPTLQATVHAAAARQLGWSPLCDLAVQGMLLVDALGRCVAVNPAAAAILGLDQAGLLGQPLDHFQGRLAAPGGRAPDLASAGADREVRRLSLSWSRPAGEPIWLELSAEPLPAGGLLICFQDTTATRTHRLRLERAASLFAALSLVNQAVVWAADPAALMARICDLMVEPGPFRLAWFGLTEVPGTALRVAARQGDALGYLDALPGGAGDLDPTATAIRENRPCIANDFQDSLADLPRRAAAARSGLAAAAAFPIRKGGAVCGALVVHAAERGFFGHQELGLLEEAAEAVSAALDRFELRGRRQRAEEALRISEERLRDLTEAASEWIWEVDQEGRYTYASEAIRELLGHAPEEVLGRTPFDLMPPEEAARVAAIFAGFAAQGLPFKDLENVNRHKDGSRRVLLTNGLPVLDGQGRLCGYRGLDRDVTVERDQEAALKHSEARFRTLAGELEQRVAQRTAELEASNRDLEAFSYSVLHDLRAPLRSIDGFSGILLEDYQDRLDPAGRQHLTRIRNGTRRMLQLIEDLLSLSQVSHRDLVWADLDLAGLCRELLDEWAQAAPGPPFPVLLQEAGLRVRADRGLLRVVLENLLRNAIKFTSKVPAPRIEVGALAGAGGERVFFVRDNGAGFDMAQADKLFDAFQRLPSAADFEGTGIGLAIVQRVIHRHGGRIWAEAAPGAGAAFFFTLPG